jgi:MarR family transcriptional regulator, organic hydroperoxide resistance regulator
MVVFGPKFCSAAQHEMRGPVESAAVRRTRSISSKKLLPQEQTVLERLGHLRKLNFKAMWVVSNLFRASTAVRRHMEASVLARDQLSWTSFTTLWVLWIWGTMEVRELAAGVGISRPTTTGVVATLKGRGCVRSRRGSRDGRSVFVALTPRGRRTIERLFMSFNVEEGAVTQQLSPNEQDILAGLLRAVLRSAEAANGSVANAMRSVRSK